MDKNGVKRIRMSPEEFVSGKGGWILPLTESEIQARQKEQFRKSGFDLINLIKDKLGDDVDVSQFEDIFAQNTNTETKKKRRQSGSVKTQSATKKPKQYEEYSMESQAPYSDGEYVKSDDDE